MKQFIVLAVTLPLMLLFIVQVTQDQLNYTKIGAINDIVYSYKEQAKQQGCFTDDLVAGMKSELASFLGISEGEIYVDATGEGEEKARGGLIHYSVELPIGTVMAGAGLLGISKQENRYVYQIDSYTTSEKLQ